MTDTARRFRTTLRLDEAVMRLAERTAARFDLTVAQLFECLLLDCAERTVNVPSPPHPRPHADVIDINDARRRGRRPA